MNTKSGMNILGIETSCDETAAAVVRDGRHVLSSVVRSQIALHRPYGGVVPEIASRSHVEELPGILEQTVQEAGTGWSGIDAVAVTYGPGLSSSLLTGLSCAKALSLSLKKPLIGIHHLEAHICSAFLGEDAPHSPEICPFTVLMVSGGHTCLARVKSLSHIELIGQTVDDAAGEAFDKGANLLGLGYPGGPAIDEASRGGNPKAVRFPRGRQRKGRVLPGRIRAELCFSFSGLKTALLYHLKAHPVTGAAELSSIAASYQEAIVDSLVGRSVAAMEKESVLAMVGGVSLNRRLREKMQIAAQKNRFRLLLAAPQYCTDNAAMVAGAAGLGLGVSGPAAMNLDVEPNLRLGSCTAGND